MGNRKIILSLILVALIASTLFYKFNSSQKGQSLRVSTQNVQTLPTKFSYKGVNGKNALQLLREKAEVVKQDQSGMVVGINKREVDAKKHEFWAFYVNGEMAKVGPLDYITQDTDQIEWKIEKY